MGTPSFLESTDPDIYVLRTRAAGPKGSLPLDAERLRSSSSGNIFGLTQNAGMGWDPKKLLGKEFLILSTQGGIRAPDGTPVALGYHTGHWEVGLLMEAAARAFSENGAVPFAAYCSDPCDGRTNGTPGMLDSLPYRNDAAMVFRRLIRSLPTCRGEIEPGDNARNADRWDELLREAFPAIRRVSQPLWAAVNERDKSDVLVACADVARMRSCRFHHLYNGKVHSAAIREDGMRIEIEAGSNGRSHEGKNRRAVG